MGHRTTKAQLQTLCDYVNDATGHAREAWSRDADGKYRANPGTFVLDYCYGGVRLSQMSGENGGQRDITARATKGETAERIRAFLAGVEYMRGQA